MKLKLIPFFIISFFSSAFSQSVLLELRNIPVELPDRKFYISKVIDSRADTSLIGWCRINKEQAGNKYKLKGGTVNGIENFLRINLPYDSTKIPLVLSIVSLYVTENGKVMKEGKAFTHVQFYKENGGNFGKIFECQSNTLSQSEFAKDIYTTHERRIRILLTDCLKKLNESNWLNAKPDFISEKELIEDGILIDTISKKYLTPMLKVENLKDSMEHIHHREIIIKKGFIPTYFKDNKKYHQLWSFKTEFNNSGDALTKKLFNDYKGKFRLTFCALGIGAALVAISFSEETYSEYGGINPGLLVPGAIFTLCSVPLYIKTNRLARNTVDRYNIVIKD